MKQYRRIIDGVVEYKNKIVLQIIKTIKTEDGEEKQIVANIYNPSEKLLLENGWEELLNTEPTTEQILLQAIENKLFYLNLHDHSDKVNNCIINYKNQEINYWIDVTKRTELEKAVKNYMDSGRSTYRLDLRDKQISITISCEKLLQMLQALEIYAIDCYNVTTNHIYTLKSMTSIEAIEAYDFTTGYPDMLIFNI